MGMRHTDFIRKILFPHECFTFYFWGELLSSFAAPVAGALAGQFLGGGDDADSAMQSSAAATDQQSRIAGEQWENYKSIYLPLEQDMAEQVRQGIVPDVAGVTGRAAADVTQSYDTVRDSTNRTLGRYGINPNSGRFASSNRALDIAEAGDKAGAVNRARTGELRRAEDVGFSRLASVVSTGRGIPSSVSSNLSSAANSYANQASTYGKSAASTSEFISGLPWNDLFGGGSTAPTRTPGINPAIPANTI